MCLTAYLHPVTMRPRRPLQCEVLVEQVRQRLTVVCQHLIAVIHNSEEFRQVVAQVVAASFLEFVEECRCPVCPIHLVAVVEEGVRPRYSRRAEGAVEALQIVAHGGAVEVVYHPPLATRSSTFHLLAGAVYIYGINGRTVYHGVFEDCLTRRLIQWYRRTAEGPSCAAVHIHLYT